DLVGFRSADLVIEAVFEDIATKRRVIAELEQVLRPEAVIASNTSALPIAEIAREARSPERIVGMHFFSPVHKMPLIEVIRPAGAPADALARRARARDRARGRGFQGQAQGRRLRPLRRAAPHAQPAGARATWGTDTSGGWRHRRTVDPHLRERGRALPGRRGTAVAGR